MGQGVSREYDSALVFHEEFFNAARSIACQDAALIDFHSPVPPLSRNASKEDTPAASTAAILVKDGRSRQPEFFDYFLLTSEITRHILHMLPLSKTLFHYMKQ
jgi:hypothetical protein